MFHEFEDEPEDLRAEMITLRVALDREIRNDVHEMRVELREVKKRNGFHEWRLRSVNTKIDSVKNENTDLKQEND